MRKMSRNVGLVTVIILSFMISSTFAATSNESGYSPKMRAKIDQMNKELKKYTDERATINKNLETFDTLDYVVFSNQEWTRLHESHSKDVKVNWPDGHSRNGEKHIAQAYVCVVYSPDTNIKVHPVKIGSGEWTSVIGVMEGTSPSQCRLGTASSFSQPGKKYSIIMCTVGRWKNRVMIEEYLFWDNLAYPSCLFVSRQVCGLIDI